MKYYICLNCGDEFEVDGMADACLKCGSENIFIPQPCLSSDIPEPQPRQPGDCQAGTIEWIEYQQRLSGAL